MCWCYFSVLFFPHLLFHYFLGQLFCICTNWHFFISFIYLVCLPSHYTNISHYTLTCNWYGVTHERVHHLTTPSATPQTVQRVPVAPSQWRMGRRESWRWSCHPPWRWWSSPCQQQRLRAPKAPPPPPLDPPSPHLTIFSQTFLPEWVLMPDYSYYSRDTSFCTPC